MGRGVRICLILLIGLSLLLSGNSSNAKNNEVFNTESIDDFTLIHPRVYKPFKFKSSLSVLFSSLPIDWTEITLAAPIFQFNTRLGLPAGFNLNCNLETAFVSNEFRLGTDWNYEKGRFSFSVGIDGVILLGYLGILEFQNKTIGFSTYPNISIGFSTGKIAFTLHAEHRLINSLKVYSGDSRADYDHLFKPGESLSIFIEQPLWKNRIMIIGLINNFQEFFYPAWPAFHVYRKWFYLPQLQLGLVL